MAVLTARTAIFLLFLTFVRPVCGDAPNGTYNVLAYGAKADGKTLNTKAINRAVMDCSRQGGGTVLFPAGVYLTGSIELLQNVTLDLDAGAVIKASPNLADYLREKVLTQGESPLEGLITARHANGSGIIGRGTIEGNGVMFMDPTKLKLVEGYDYDKKYIRQGDDYLNPKYGTNDGPWEPQDRPGNLVRFFDSTNVLLSGVTIQNSWIWTVEIARCQNVNVAGVSINSFASGRRIPNDDGIDILQSKVVHISGCDIQNGDDSIAVLGSEKVTVSDCTLSSRSTAVRVGFAGADIRDCVFANLIIHDSNRGLGVFVRGTGSVENVLFSDILIHTRLMTGHWWGKAEPIHVSAILRETNTDRIGQIKNIRFRNIIAESEDGILVHGSEQSVLKDITFEAVKIRVKNSKLQPSYGGNFDLRANRNVAMALFSHEIPALYCRYADGVKIHGLDVEWDDDLPTFFSHAIEMEDFQNVEIDGFNGGPAPGARGKAAIAVDRGRGLSIRNCHASAGTGAFVSLSNVADPGLFVNNDLRLAQRPFEPETTAFQAFANILPTK